MADEKKIVCFGWATHDSKRTMITKESNEVLVLLLGSKAVTKPVMDHALRITLDMIDQWLDCKLSEPIMFYPER